MQHGPRDVLAKLDPHLLMRRFRSFSTRSLVWGPQTLWGRRVVPWLCHRERSDPILSPSVDHSVPARGPRARRRAGWSNDRLSRTTSAARRPQSRARRRPASTAMAMVGHRTKSIYRRYAIVDETMLREGAERLTAFYRGQSPLTTVVPLRKTGQAKKTRPVTRASRPERGPQASLTT